MDSNNCAVHDSFVGMGAASNGNDDKTQTGDGQMDTKSSKRPALDGGQDGRTSGRDRLPEGFAEPRFRTLSDGRQKDTLTGYVHERCWDYADEVGR